MRVFNSQALNHLLKLRISRARGVAIVLPMRLKAGALDTLAESTLFTLSIQALHSMLDLVDRLLLSIETFDANQVEHITYQVALYRMIKGRISGHRRTQIYFNEPWFQI